jgi:hypothetical protein
VTAGDRIAVRGEGTGRGGSREALWPAAWETPQNPANPAAVGLTCGDVARGWFSNPARAAGFCGVWSLDLAGFCGVWRGLLRGLKSG